MTITRNPKKNKISATAESEANDNNIKPVYTKINDDNGYKPMQEWFVGMRTRTSISVFLPHKSFLTILSKYVPCHLCRQRAIKVASNY